MPDADRANPCSESPAHQFDELLAAVRAHGGLPSVGHTLARLTQLLEADSDAVPALADVILSDVALTQRLLRIANTIPYRNGPQAVTTVTRAIMLLGFDQVRSTAMSLVLVDGLMGARLPALRADFHQSLLAGSLARELLAGSEAEEASIAAMFRGIGRLLVAVFAPQVHVRIRTLVLQERSSESAAARRVLGRSLNELTELLLRDWSVPDRIVSAVQPLPARLDGPTSSAERVRAAAQFAEASRLRYSPIQLGTTCTAGRFDVTDSAFCRCHSNPASSPWSPRFQSRFVMSRTSTRSSTKPLRSGRTSCASVSTSRPYSDGQNCVLAM